MYLKEVVMSGFKSFADKMDIKLDNKTTCIVGPNGSGKSNVVDAVRWVLGEQSVKSLRGDGSMSDVIFSGSKSRKALNVASVELIFDNSDHFLQVPYTELSIKRRVYRSGENEYFLNNERCRLKDLNNLLMDTGMGKESFNIISQGEVEKIISNSPYDRRVIFEEAAGILKYKRRKDEALRKLDKTHDNIDRINDIISEIETQIRPLEEQSRKAREYLENKAGLDKYEVALLAYDIEDYSNKLNDAKSKKEELDNEILTISSDDAKNDVEFLNLNNKLSKLEKEKKELQDKLLKLTEEAEKVNGEKNLLNERSKLNSNQDEVKLKIKELFIKQNEINSKLDVSKEELKIIIDKSKDLNNESDNCKSKIERIKTDNILASNDYSKMDRDLINLNHKKDSLQRELDSMGNLPNSVRSVIQSNELLGIHNTIGNILSTSDKFIRALDIAIAGSRNFIITTDEESSKKAIRYLRDNHLGRATFFPLNVIKARYVDSNTLDKLNDNSEYLGVLSDLVKYDKKYENIVKNQLGTVLVADSLDSATRISHIIGGRYKIVSLDGDVIHVGGSMSGGSVHTFKSSVTIRQELNNIDTQINNLKNRMKKIDLKINSSKENQNSLEDKYFEFSRGKVTLKEKYDIKNDEVKALEKELESINTELDNLKTIESNSLDSREEELISKYYELTGQKKNVFNNLLKLDDDIDNLKHKIEESGALNKLKNSKLHNLEREVRELDVLISKYDVKLDNMLSVLSDEYELSFSKAKSDYQLDIEPDDARIKVNTYRANIKRIGMVNLDAIEEYDRVNNRYLFLTNQRQDLLGAQETLLDIMNEMDGVMKEEFINAFEKIQVEFKKVFSELFGGGSASLKLTDPEDLLKTGVEIIASPPGKKLSSISLLSGGEKTLTAISLLFAMLNVRMVPFCLFDEVEAALDEANVEGFGKYLDNYRDKTQFLIITHKKKTMEYASTLYGITMQESGVSKLVSVKLTDHKD